MGNATRHWRTNTLATAIALALSTQADAGFSVTNSNDSGPGSLREAIADANANPGDDEITIASGLSTIVLTSGQLTVTETVTIIGPAVGQTISGHSNSRIFGLSTEFATLTLRNLTLTDGTTTADGQSPVTCETGTGRGGAVCALGDLVMENTTVSNSSTTGMDADGGGIFVRRGVNFSDCTLTGNSTSGDNAGGGAVFLRNASSTTSNLESCTISNNQTEGENADGGGLYAYSGINLTASVVSGNQVLGNFSYGAGLFERFLGASATITNSVIRDNSSNVFYGRGGGAYLSAGALVRDSTISGNSTQGDRSRGGGLVLGDNSTLINSTVSGNSTSGNGSQGGGIYQRANTLNVSNSTIVGNSTKGGGGGIDLLNRFESGVSATLNLESSFLAGNDSPAGNFESGGDDVLTVNASHSVFGDPAEEVNGISTAVIFDDTLMLGSVADNGCTQPAGAPGSQECVGTHAIPDGSPVIDAGDNPQALAGDQRGADFPRVQGIAADIGAIEKDLEPTISLSPLIVDFGDVPVGETSAPLQVTVESTGSGTLEIDAIDAAAKPFARSGGSCPSGAVFMLPPGNNCTITYQFAPLDPGMAAQTIAVTSNATSGPGSFDLIGDGVTPELTASPGFIDFGDLAIGAPAALQSLQLENTGGGELLVNTFTFEGRDAGDFGVGTDNCTGNPLALGQTCLVEIRFDAAEPGVKTAELTIDSNDPLAPAVVPLSGSLDVEFADGFED